MKICPYCAEEIQDEAIKCKHCGEFLNGAGTSPAPGNLLPWYFRTPTLVIALLSGLALALPLVWWHPKLTMLWKVVISVVTVALTWFSIQTIVQVWHMMNENLEMLKNSGIY